MNVPTFWENDLDKVRSVVANVTRGACSVLTKSAGGRDIYLVEYGEKQDLKRKANYLSALESDNHKAYADKEGTKPIVLIVGATHGGEVEGLASVLNLIQAIETGTDFRGRAYPRLDGVLEQYRLLIIPCLNPDGRARVSYSITPVADQQEVHIHKFGIWTDGSVVYWRPSFGVHPIKGAVTPMGGYYNDDGVNIHADNVFAPMAPETKALLKLVDREAPDFTVLLHTGCWKHAKVMQAPYIPGYMGRRLREFDERLCTAVEGAGLTYYSIKERGPAISADDIEPPPPAFTLESAIHHSCGGLCIVYESAEASDDEGYAFTLEGILDCHFLLFEETLKYANTFRGEK